MDQNFIGHCIECSKDIESLASGWGRNEYPCKAPDHSKKSSMYKMGCIDEENLSLSFFCFGKTRCQLFFQKSFLFLLFFRIRCLPGHETDFQSLHSHSLHESSYLSWRSFDSGNIFNGSLCLGRIAWWMFSEVLFQSRSMLVQRAGLSLVCQLLESFDSSIPILLEIAGQSHLADPAKATDITVGQSLTLQIECVHLPLDFRMRMMVAPVCQDIDCLFGEFDSYHYALLSFPGSAAYNEAL